MVVLSLSPNPILECPACINSLPPKDSSSRYHALGIVAWHRNSRGYKQLITLKWSYNSDYRSELSSIHITFMAYYLQGFGFHGFVYVWNYWNINFIELSQPGLVFCSPCLKIDVSVKQWFSAFIMLQPFYNTVLHVVMSPNHKIILLLLHN